MCTQNAATAPEFFLHHGMVDKIWEDWQKRSTVHRTAFYPTVTEVMPKTDGLLPGALIDNLRLPGNVRAEYAGLGNVGVRNIVNKLRKGTVMEVCSCQRSSAFELTTATYVLTIGLYPLPCYKSQYDALITSHKTYFQQGIHLPDEFLPWHRWYILQYENLLRKVDCRFTVAYWDWVAVAGNPWATTPGDLWYSGYSGFGGSGQPPNRCVRTGPFRQQIWQLVPSVPAPRCLKRNFNGNPPGEVELALLLNIPPSQFQDFEDTLRGLFHDNIHCLIDGTMCSFDAAAAPEFFLHHGLIDKLIGNGLRGGHGVRVLSHVVVEANHDQEPVQTQHQPMVDDPVLGRVLSHGLVLHILVHRLQEMVSGLLGDRGAFVLSRVVVVSSYDQEHVQILHQPMHQFMVSGQPGEDGNAVLSRVELASNHELAPVQVLHQLTEDGTARVQANSDRNVNPMHVHRSMVSGPIGEVGGAVLSRVAVVANHEGVHVPTHHQPMVDAIARDRSHRARNAHKKIAGVLGRQHHVIYGILATVVLEEMASYPTSASERVLSGSKSGNSFHLSLHPDA
ncbi:hypothetical protein QZH41_002473 [Actinostola sp. cb2023]|nr:hypothetical protein QZH41_002473 [Actinostola sp. cb2023]